MRTLGRWLCGLGVVSILLVLSVGIEARGGGSRGAFIRSRIRQQSTIACGPALYAAGRAVCSAPSAVKPEQGVA